MRKLLGATALLLSLSSGHAHACYATDSQCLLDHLEELTQRADELELKRQGTPRNPDRLYKCLDLSNMARKDGRLSEQQITTGFWNCVASRQ